MTASSAKDTTEKNIDLSELLGLRADPMRWSGLGAFLLANWAMTVVIILFGPMQVELPPLHLWIGQAVRCAVLTAAVGLGFRVMKGQFMAALSSAVVYGVVCWVLFRYVPALNYYHFQVLSNSAAAFCHLAGLVFMLRMFKASWIALLLGSLAGVGGFEVLATLMQLLGFYSFFSFGVTIWSLIKGVVFGLALWGGLHLFPEAKSPVDPEGPKSVGPS